MLQSMLVRAGLQTIVNGTRSSLLLYLQHDIIKTVPDCMVSGRVLPYTCPA
jgi:hypothetical protein